MEPYCLIGNMIVVGRTGKTLSGPVVASKDAIIMVVTGDSAQQQLNNGIRGIGGLMGKMDGLIQSIPVPGLDEFETDLPALREKLDDADAFPAELVGERAFFFPRDRICRLRRSLLGNLSFDAGPAAVVIYGSGKQSKAAAAFLQHQGWPVDTRTFFQRLFGKAG